MSYGELDRVGVIERVIQKRLTQREAARARLIAPAPGMDSHSPWTRPCRPAPRKAMSVLVSRRLRAPPAAVPQSGCVPELSRFFGIVIRMFTEIGGPHHRPHFHAYYQERAAIFGIDPIELLAGDLPRRQQRLVEAWAELHQPELGLDWERLQSGLPARPIEPLR